MYITSNKLLKTTDVVCTLKTEMSLREAIIYNEQEQHYHEVFNTPICNYTPLNNSKSRTGLMTLFIK